MKDKIDYIFNRFPGDIKTALLRIDERIKYNIEEIRIQAEGNLLVYTSNKEYSLNTQNRIVEGVNNCKVISKETLTGIFNALLNYSAYAYEDEVANGYITISGGHRVGVCGKVVMENGNIKTLKDISSLNIRRSKEIIGISERYMKYILKDDMSFYNTLIVSPPKCGKTTLLRDIARNLSNRNFKIGMVDERSEIAGMFEGIPQNDIGLRTHVLDGCPKDKGIIMMIRSMSPDVIVTDEIGKKEDVYAIECAINAGIGLLTTIHGASYQDLLGSNIGEVIEKNVFKRIIFLKNIPTTGHVESIMDADCNPVYPIQEMR